MCYIMSDLDYKVSSKDLRDVVQYVDNADKYSRSLLGMAAVPKDMFDMDFSKTR